MSRDYKNSGTAAAGGRGSSMWVGILIGLLVGLCLALGVALYINKGANPFFQKQKAVEKSPEKPSEPQKETPAVESSRAAASASDKHAKNGEAKPRFDF